MKSVHEHVCVSSLHNSIQLQRASVDTGDLPHPNETATQKGKRKKNEEPKPKPLPAHTKVRTWNADEVVDLAVGETGIEAEKPVTVGQLFKDAVARFPMHPALKYKEDRIWKIITYTGYYDLCIKAAKSFLKVRVGAAYLNCTVGLFL